MAETDLSQANEAFKAADWDRAATLYAKVYDDKPTSKVNHLLAQSLFKKGDSDEAEAVIKEDYNSYFSDEYHFLFVIQVMLERRNIIGANQISLYAQDQGWLKSAQALIDEAEEKVRSEPGFDDRYRHYYHLADGNGYEQPDRYSQGQGLPKAEWVTATKHALVDPFVSPLIRVDMLGQLHSLQLDETVSFLWPDGTEREWVPKAGTSLDDDPTMFAITQYLANYFGRTGFDVTLREQLERSIVVVTGFLYPYIGEVVTDPATWVKLGLARFGFEEGLVSVDKNTPEFAKMAGWYDKIESLFNEMNE